jgi:hypothetical protein
MLKKFNTEDVSKGEVKGHVALAKAAQKTVEFELKFFTYVTGLSEEKFIDMYAFFLTEVRREILLDYGIIVTFGGKYQEYFIPKDKLDLIEWVKANCDVKYHIVSRTPIWFGNSNYQKSTYWRDKSKELTTNFNLKHNIK